MAGVGSWKAPRKYEDIAGTLDEHLCFAIIFYDFLWLYGLAEKKYDSLKILFHGPFLVRHPGARELSEFCEVGWSFSSQLGSL